MSFDDKTDPYSFLVRQHLSLEEKFKLETDENEKEKLAEMLEDVWFSMTPEERKMVISHG